jgi:hypothetical protein
VLWQLTAQRVFGALLGVDDIRAIHVDIRSNCG